MVSVFFCLWGTDGLRILKSIGKTTHDFLRKAHTKSNDFRGKAERGAMAAEEGLHGPQRLCRNAGANPVDMQWRARQDVMIFRQGPCTDGGNPHKIR